MAEYHFIAEADAAGQRLDRFLSNNLPDHSRASLKKIIEQGGCAIDGITTNNAVTKIRAGQNIVLTLVDNTCTLTPEQGDIEILWQDEHLAVINKPAGLTVHPCPSCLEGTLVHRLLAHFPQLAEQEGMRPGIVHRLDKDTSGILIIALTEAARLRLASAFSGREVHKEYLALVHGIPTHEGECNAPIGRHPHIKVKMAVVPENRGGRPARSTWRVLWQAPDGLCSLVAVRIFTGRTHQIRVHMAYCGHPLWGDAVYGANDAENPLAARLSMAQQDHLNHTNMPTRQMLHAWHIGFHHPFHNTPLEFYCPPPSDICDAAVQICARRMQRLVITGNPGCGKSSLTKQLAELGLPSFSADEEVRRLYVKHAAGWDFLHQRYGSRFLQENGEINRPCLLQAMRTEADLRRDVEAYIHTLVKEALENFWHTEEARGTPCAVAEVPLYFEADWHNNAFLPKPLVITVTCPMPIRHARLLATRGWSAETSAILEAWQWPQEHKEAACTWLIDNSGSEDMLHAHAHEILHRVANLKVQEEQKLRHHLATLWTA